MRGNLAFAFLRIYVFKIELSGGDIVDIKDRSVKVETYRIGMFNYRTTG